MTLEQALAELRSPDPQVRARAVRWLRVLGGPQAVAALIAALDDPSEEVFPQAALALGEMQVREAVPILIGRVESDRRWEERAFYLGVLGDIGDPRAKHEGAACPDTGRRRR
jgi:HEAT repeat protein